MCAMVSRPSISPRTLVGADDLEKELLERPPPRGDPVEVGVGLAERHLADDAAALDEGDAVARDLDFAEEVGVEEDGRSGRPEVADHVADEAPADRVEPRRRL